MNSNLKRRALHPNACKVRWFSLPYMLGIVTWYKSSNSNLKICILHYALCTARRAMPA